MSGQEDTTTTTAAQEAAVAEEAVPAPAVEEDSAAAAVPEGEVDFEDAEAVPAAEAPAAAEAEEADPLAAAREEAGRYLALAQRTQADFDNYRKRTQRDLAAAEQRGVTRTVKELLPALDNLERAIAAHPDDQLTEGIRLVHAELTAALGRVGVRGYSPRGEPFDPTVHEAMAQQPVEGAESGTVVEVYQQGYRANGAVLRPARVVVAQ